MSLYNMVNGVQMETWFFLPMLGKHPDEYPRFRDCVIGRLKNHKSEKDEIGIPLRIKKFKKGKREISVYMRIGGGNRKEYSKEIKELRAIPEYVTDYDDDFDSTYVVFIFDCPKKWEKDYDILLDRKKSFDDTTDKYKAHIEKVYPKLKDKLPWSKSK